MSGQEEVLRIGGRRNEEGLGRDIADESHPAEHVRHPLAGRTLPSEQQEHTAFGSPPLDEHGHHRPMAVTQREIENRLWDADDELRVAMPEARSPRTGRGRRR